MDAYNTTVLIHGCHLEAEDWYNIVWGDLQNNKYGRLPIGIITAIIERADKVIIGTGASTAKPLNKKEATYTRDHLIQQTNELIHSEKFQSEIIDAGLMPENMQDWITNKIILDVNSEDTVSEIKNAISQTRRKLILVTSPTHLPRCIKEAYVLVNACNDKKLPTIYGTASDTAYANSTAADVAIIEPPHRGDMSKESLHLIAGMAAKVFYSKIPKTFIDMPTIASIQREFAARLEAEVRLFARGKNLEV